MHVNKICIQFFGLLGKILEKLCIAIKWNPSEKFQSILVVKCPLNKSFGSLFLLICSGEAQWSRGIVLANNPINSYF